MSSAVAPTQDAFTVDEDVVDALEEGGSLPEPKIQADTSEGQAAAKPEGEEPKDVGEAEGVEPKAGDGAGKVPDAWLEQKQEYEAKLAAAEQTFADIRAIARTNPAVAEAFGFTEGGAKSGGGWRETAFKALEDLTPDSKEIMAKVLGPMAERLEQLERQQGTVGSTVNRLAQTTAEANFRQALVEAKVPVDNPQFQKILAGLMKDPDFQSARTRGAALAVRTAKAEWFAQQGRSATNGDARVQLAAAKSGKNPGRTTGAPLAEKIIELSGPYDWQASHRLRMEAAKAGRAPPKIVWKD